LVCTKHKRKAREALFLCLTNIAAADEGADGDHDLGGFLAGRAGRTGGDLVLDGLAGCGGAGGLLGGVEEHAHGDLGVGVGILLPVHQQLLAVAQTTSVMKMKMKKR
jgi:hypothetical protein